MFLSSKTLRAVKNSFINIINIKKKFTGLDAQEVIIFGGFGPGFRQDLNPDNSLYVLDLNNFNWRIPKVTGKIPSSRGFSKTVLIGKYIVITFGIIKR